MQDCANAAYELLEPYRQKLPCHACNNKAAGSDTGCLSGSAPTSSCGALDCGILPAGKAPILALLPGCFARLLAFVDTFSGRHCLRL